MKRRDDGPRPLRARQRASLAVMGLVVLVPGLVVMLRGGSSYVDWRGLVAFAPAMVVVGLFIIVMAVVKGRSAHTK